MVRVNLAVEAPNFVIFTVKMWSYNEEGRQKISESSQIMETWIGDEKITFAMICSIQ